LATRTTTGRFHNSVSKFNNPVAQNAVWAMVGCFYVATAVIINIH
jgi:hypothetical protein